MGAQCARGAGSTGPFRASPERPISCMHGKGCAGALPIRGGRAEPRGRRLDTDSCLAAARCIRKASASIVGFVAFGLCAYAAFELLSSNTHDRAMEAAMTAIFVAGPLGGIVGGILGARLSKRAQAGTEA